MPLSAWTWSTVIVLAYLAGSFPTAYLAVRWRTGQDLRRLGDGNVGAENAARVLGSWAGVLVATVDLAKGVLVILLVRWWTGSITAEMVAGVLAIAGHSWPVFLRGHGGRGAATAAGLLLVVLPYPAIPLGLLGLVIIYLTRSTTWGLAFLYISNLLVSLSTLLLLPPSGRSWPLDYTYATVGYALALPLLVGGIHFLSLQRRPGNTPEPSEGVD